MSNLDSILGAIFGQPQRNPAKDGDALAAGVLASHELNAASAIEACLCAAVHIMVLSRTEEDLIKSLDTMDIMLTMAKHDVIESIHNAGHGRASLLAETKPDLTKEQVTAHVDRVHQTTCVGAMLAGASTDPETIPLNTHNNLKRAEAEFRGRLETLAAAMKDSKEAQEANAAH